VHSTISFFQAIVLGLTQGVTELFPISSLGHGVLLPALFGWHNLVGAETQKTGFYLAFLVGLHVGTAVGLLVFYRRTWFKLFGGLGRQAKSPGGLKRFAALNDPSTDKDYRLLALLVIGTIPVGIIGLVFEKKLRELFTKPLAAAIFLTINGVILLGGEFLRRRTQTKATKASLDTLSSTSALTVGSSQILALFAGISRSGVTIVAGLLRGLDHEDSANFAFLLATPVILLAGLYELPKLLGPTGDGIRVQSIVGAVCAGVASYLSARFLTRWFHSHTLWPFAIYSLVFGTGCVAYFA